MERKNSKHLQIFMKSLIGTVIFMVFMRAFVSNFKNQTVLQQLIIGVIYFVMVYGGHLISDRIRKKIDK